MPAARGALMLTRIARLATRYPKRVLLAALALALICGGFGATVTAHLQAGGFTSGKAESTRAAQLVADQFNGAQPNLVLLVHADEGVESAAARAVGADIAARLGSRSDTVGVRSYWTS